MFRSVKAVTKSAISILPRKRVACRSFAAEGSFSNHAVIPHRTTSTPSNFRKMSSGDSTSAPGTAAAPAKIDYHVLDKKAFDKTIKLKALKVKAGETGVVLGKLRAPYGSKTGAVLMHPSMRSVEHAAPEEGGIDYRVILLSPQGFDLSTGGLSSPAVVEDTHQLTPEQLESLKGVEHSFIERTITVGYEQMSADEVLRRVLPAELEQVPCSFETIGCLAHINLRPEYERFKYTIGQVMLDKNNNIKTVLNKTGNIDTTFRTFPMEVLAGEDTTEVDIKHAGARFHLDFRKVYWNSRLAHEHELIATELIPARSVVADMFCGVGPFAVPLAVSPRSCVVHANDLNPESYKCLTENVRRNKVQDRVFPYNMDAREFIRRLARDNVPFQYAIMNLPADAASFLDVFVGCFKGLSETVPNVHGSLLAPPPPAAPVPRWQQKKTQQQGKEAGQGGSGAAGTGAGAAAQAPSPPPVSLPETIPRPQPYVLCHAFCKTHTFEDAVADITRRAMLQLQLITSEQLPFTPPCYDFIGNEVLRSRASGGDEDNDDDGDAKGSSSSSSSSLKFKSSEAKKAVPEEVRAQAAAARKAIADYASSALPDLTVREVRNVAPNKVMVCVQFTVPKHVLYGTPSTTSPATASASSSSSSADAAALPAKRPSSDGGKEEEDGGSDEPAAKRGRTDGAE